ncbi:CTLH/CRA C-terminal to lish motif domain-containing protein [Obelidium mucronatum]|nr:CTLH/CRA C-terminal to lish motif domain-containing protein [Obelidium mucronatum]
MDLLADFDKARVLDKQQTTAAASLAGIERRAALDAHRDAHAAVARYAKAVERRFKADLDAIWNPRALDAAPCAAVVRAAVARHLVRDARGGLARALLAEASTNVTHDPHESEDFADMYSVLDAVKRFDLAPAMQWVHTHSASLKLLDSDLEFHVVRLQFLKLLFGVSGVCAGNRDAALEYAKEKLSPFKDAHMKEIQKLMCCLLYTNKIAQSPYKSLTENTAWSDLSHQFTRDFCLLRHLPAESPLHTCVSVGVNALPTIIKMSSILKEQSGLEWSTQGELPVEIPLLDRQRFHSIFACPVSKELGTKENPPMMMVCGHVVCKESLLRLGKGNMATKFKCPYCPSEGKGEQAVMVYF